MKIYRFFAASVFTLMVEASPSSAQDVSLSLSDVRAVQCLTLLLANGEQIQSGGGCTNRNVRVSDCVVLDIPGQSQRVDGIGRPIRGGERVRIGGDCQEDSSTRHPAGIEPTIADRTVPWSGPDFEREFVAELSPGSGHEITSVYLKQTRHFWPGAELAHYFPAVREGTSNLFTVVPPQNDFWVQADHVFYEWHVEYVSELNGNAGDAKSTNSDPHNFVFDCTDQQIDVTLSLMVTIANAFNDNPLFNPGYPVPSHILPHISLRNQGMPYATPAAIAEVGQVTLASPSLLQFRPGAGSGPNRFFGARLEGLAYGTLFASQTRRPTMGCVPSSEWFVHEAGWHSADGGMTPLAVSESVPGQVSGPLLPPNGDPVGWHPRLWDLHVWLPKNPGGNATLAIDSPVPIPGLPLSAGAFFYPETFE